MRRLLLILVAMAAMAVVSGDTASAHEHQICIPGAGDPVLAPEPFHGEDPSGGAILNNPNVNPTQYATWGLHPLHHFLHLGPSGGERAITVIRLGTGVTCPTG